MLNDHFLDFDSWEYWEIQGCVVITWRRESSWRFTWVFNAKPIQDRLAGQFTSDDLRDRHPTRLAGAPAADSLGTFTMISGTDAYTRIAGAPAAETSELTQKCPVHKWPQRRTRISIPAAGLTWNVHNDLRDRRLHSHRRRPSGRFIGTHKYPLHKRSQIQISIPADRLTRNIHNNLRWTIKIAL